MTHPLFKKIYELREQPTTEVELAILHKHEEWDHRKAIRKALQEEDINVSSRQLKNVLGRCRVCLERDNKYVHTNKCSKNR